MNCSAFQGPVVRKVCHFCDFGSIPEPAKTERHITRNCACFPCFACTRGKPFVAKRQSIRSKQGRMLALGSAVSHLIYVVQTVVRVCRTSSSRRIQSTIWPRPNPWRPSMVQATQGERGVGKAFTAIWQTFLAKHIIWQDSSNAA
jgi:hypothetical protein